ncbi:MAG: 8-oxo-dGTP diphosphatase [Oscillospiraceae bacterium]|nr:8-oxo-dGTP diphosphatase [Oscillospiraceae bacterium]
MNSELEITNMVMIQDKTTGKVIVQDRVKSWCGITFPGGHVENQETIYDSAVREIKEETGLDIRNLKFCGFMWWFNNKTCDRYYTYFYKTSDWSGELINETAEGKVYWVDLSEIPEERYASNFKEHLPMFLEDKYSEAYCSWNDDMKPDMTKENPWGVIYR